MSEMPLALNALLNQVREILKIRSDRRKQVFKDLLMPIQQSLLEVHKDYLGFFESTAALCPVGEAAHLEGGREALERALAHFEAQRENPEGPLGGML